MITIPFILDVVFSFAFDDDDERHRRRLDTNTPFMLIDLSISHARRFVWDSSTPKLVTVGSAIRFPPIFFNLLLLFCCIN